uniref:Serine/threonine-protein kinase kin-29 n=1 Tax=Heterorhabditis bacteriophora TaxID=37862 RepID=A0A1I7WWY1_HETBA
MGGDNSQERRLAALPNDPEGFLNLGDHCGLLTAIMEGRRRLRLERVGPYQVGRVIGRGNFATVRLARHEIAKTKVALKMVDKTAIDEENLLKVEREIRILKSIEHPHIIKLYEVIRTDRYIYIVTEYCSGGELYEVLIERGRTAEDEAKRWFGQVSSALAYLHQRGVVHRDLKAENVLLDKNNNIKIIDFGFSNLQMPNQLLNTWCGSPPYAAPELLLGKEYDGLKADIWSLGVLLYILVTGGFPFPGDSVDKLKRAVLSGQVKIPYWVSVECADLIRKMLVLNPLKRYGINNVIQHRWMTNSQSTKTHLLVKNSLLTASSLLPERKLLKLNPTILLFMQQHGKWSEEQITEDVLKKNYDSAIFATYELLCDKVGRRPTDDHPRRGSRGSILSGKANVEPEPLTPTISAHHLAQLNLSTSPECVNIIASILFTNSFTKSDSRRHTLCASEQILSSDMMAQLPIGSPLHQVIKHS